MFMRERTRQICFINAYFSHDSSILGDLTLS